MLHLRSSIIAHLLSYPSTFPSSSVQRLLYATAPRVVPSPRFAVEEYLVDTSGLTRAQALKGSSSKLTHLKSPSNPDAVLAFLAGLGLSSAEVAALVAKDPKFLYAGVERVLSPILVGLTGLGLSHSEIARLVLLVPASFRCRSVVSNLTYYLSLFGSYENLRKVLLKCRTNILGSSLENVVKPNVALLLECGLSASDITKLCINASWLLSTNLDRLLGMVACAEGLGVPRGSVLFRHALRAVAFLTKEKVTAKVEYLKNTLRCSDAEVRIAVSKLPMVLTRSKESLQHTSEFLLSEVGLEPSYIAHRPALLCYSLEGRIKPRCYAVMFLKENGLLKRDPSYYAVVPITEKVFVEKFICP
ncbi:unnamed protein product [Alopecurus aequalis]